MPLICRGCRRELLTEELSQTIAAKKFICPQCGARDAFELKPDPPADPTRPYELNAGDRRFLRSLAIASEPHKPKKET